MTWLDRVLPPLPSPGPLGWNLQPQLFHDPNHLAQVMVPYDLFGAYPRILTRAQAMTVPAVARGRHLTAGTIAGLPLVVLTGADPLPDQPGWAHATDGQTGTLTAAQAHRLGIAPQSPWSRLLWTVDDLVFYPHSLWAATALDAENRPARLARVELRRIGSSTTTATSSTLTGSRSPFRACSSKARTRAS